jgi:hypothetical protein
VSLINERKQTLELVIVTSYRAMEWNEPAKTERSQTKGVIIMDFSTCQAAGSQSQEFASSPRLRALTVWLGRYA